MFLSHTSELRDFPRGTSYVAAAERAVSAAGHVVVDMAGFPAAGQAPARVCAELVRGCDVYIGVLGTRYGSAVRDRPEVSYTELEFDTAAEAGLDRLVFLLDTAADDVGTPPSALIDREFGDRQDAFRRRVQDSGLTTLSFASPDALGQLVERSLRELAGTRRGAGGGSGRAQVRGWPLAEVRDPFALEVHRPVQPDNPEPGLPELPVYVPRGYDMELGRVVRAAAEGRSGIAVGQDPGLLGGAGSAAGPGPAVAAVASDRPVPPRCGTARPAGDRAADRGVAERGPVLPRHRGRRAGRAGRRRAAGAAAGPGPGPGAGAGHAVAPVLGWPDRPP